MDWQQSQVKLFRALLFCYPAEFRHEYGAEMEQLFFDRLHSEPSRRLWWETLADLACSAPREHLSVLGADLRYGIRVLARTPGFTAMALLVMALGLGVTVSIFSLVNAVLLRSLPYPQAERLVYLWSPNRNLPGVPDELGPSVPDIYAWQQQNHSFSTVALLMPTVVPWVRAGSSRRVGAASVTSDFFHTLGVGPEIGRLFTAEEDRPGQTPVVVISDALWRSQFGAISQVLGQTMQLNRQNYTIVGVMPPGFGYPFAGDIPYESSEFPQTDLWFPAAYTDQQRTDRTNFASAVAIGRLRPGVSAATAQKELAAIESRLQPLYPAMWRGWTVLVRPLPQTILGPVEKLLWLLLGAVGLVLLIAISNVAHLLLARGTARAHEFGLRAALGAERGRLLRQLLTESLLLSGVGGAFGVALAYAAVRGLTRLNPGHIPRFETASVDGRVLLVALLLSIGTGILSGLFPALAATKADVNEALRKGSSRIVGVGHRSRFALIVGQVALSVILLTASGLLIRSYWQLAAVVPGFSPATLTFRVHLDERYQTFQQQTGFYQSFLAKLQDLPGVQHAGAANSTPLSGHESVTSAEIRGWGKAPRVVEVRSVTPGYRQALGTPLRRGRDLDEHDIHAKTPVVLINEAFAAAYFPHRDPLGGQLRIGMGDLPSASWQTVVGVVGNIRHNSLEETSQPQIFQPVVSGDHFALRCQTLVLPVEEQVRRALRSLDPVLTIEDVHTMKERMTISTTRRRFQTTLLTSFAAIAVALALVGLYALLSYSVEQRTAEIGVRLAVCSTRSQILRLILAQGLRLTMSGLLLGLGGALALTHLISSWLFGVKAIDPLTFLIVPLFVVTVACGACLLPAWKATRIDPLQALRQE